MSTSQIEDDVEYKVNGLEDFLNNSEEKMREVDLEDDGKCLLIR